MARIYVGMSGFTYPGWKGGFYPRGLARKDELSYAAGRVSSLEINTTFYRYQTPGIFRRWYEATPADFKFAVKASRVITHQRRLKEIDRSLANFLASGLLCLGEKLGPILWQFPPHVTLKDERFERFFKQLPRDHFSAAELARDHSEQMQGRVFTDPTVNYPLQHAVEFRHTSFQNKDFIAMMASMGVGLVCTHAPEPPGFYLEDVTSEHVYLRMHGHGKAFANGYTSQALDGLAEHALAWRDGHPLADTPRLIDTPSTSQLRDVFLYFDNEPKEKSPFHAVELLEKIAKLDDFAKRTARRRA